MFLTSLYCCVDRLEKWLLIRFSQQGNTCVWRGRCLKSNVRTHTHTHTAFGGNISALAIEKNSYYVKLVWSCHLLHSLLPVWLWESLCIKWPCQSPSADMSECTVTCLCLTMSRRIVLHYPRFRTAVSVMWIKPLSQPARWRRSISSSFLTCGMVAASEDDTGNMPVVCDRQWCFYTLDAVTSTLPAAPSAVWWSFSHSCNAE